MQHLRQRADDGYPVGADSIMREAYGPIPDVELFQKRTGYGYEVPKAVHGWEWSSTFNRWSALVTFSDGTQGITWPAPWKKHHNDCPHCGQKLSRSSENGFDVIYECPDEFSHHRHIIRGITGEYVTLRSGRWNQSASQGASHVR